MHQSNLINLLENKRIPWKAYFENIPSRCSTVSAFVLSSRTLYSRSRNPFISLKNIQTNSTLCNKIVQATQLNLDANARQLPTYMFYKPNLNNDGTNTFTAEASRWLQGFLLPKMQDPVWNQVSGYKKKIMTTIFVNVHMS
jgi:hypothetical protein